MIGDIDLLDSEPSAEHVGEGFEVEVEGAAAHGCTHNQFVGAPGVHAVAGRGVSQAGTAPGYEAPLQGEIREGTRAPAEGVAVPGSVDPLGASTDDEVGFAQRVEARDLVGVVREPGVHGDAVLVSPLGSEPKAVEQSARDVGVLSVTQQVGARNCLDMGDGIVRAAVVHHAHVGVRQAERHDFFDRLRFVVGGDDDQQGPAVSHSGEKCRAFSRSAISMSAGVLMFT